MRFLLLKIYKLYLPVFLGIGFLLIGGVGAENNNKSIESKVKKDPISIVIIDHLKVRDSSKEVKDIKEQVDALIENMRKDILEKEAVLRKEYNDLVNNKPKVDKDGAYKKKLASFRARLSQLQVSSRKNKNKIEKAYRKAMDIFSQKFTKIIMDFQKEQNVDIMLRRENVLFYRKDLDKTDELIDRMNKAYKKVNIKIEAEDE